MNYFINYKNGKISINTYRDPVAMVTDVDDIRRAIEEGIDESLTAAFNEWITEFGGSLEDDYLEGVIECEFGLQLADYPELRDIQRDASDE